MESTLFAPAIQAGNLGALVVMIFLGFRYLRQEQADRKEEVKAKEKLATALSKMNEGGIQIIEALRDMQIRCSATQAKCQESTKFLGDFVKDLKHGVKVDS